MNRAQIIVAHQALGVEKSFSSAAEKTTAGRQMTITAHTHPGETNSGGYSITLNLCPQEAKAMQAIFEGRATEAREALVALGVE